MRTTKLRWGFLGAAEIARKNYRGIHESGNGVVTAVASRDADRAREFITQCQAEASFDPIPSACGSYEDLLARSDVDAVYIPLPTALRKQWVLRAAEAGKHVVCEKPCAVTVADLQEMIEACRRHGVQFMDGVMFVHSERLAAMGATLRESQTIGETRRIDSAFSFGAPPEFWTSNIRAHSELEPLGALGDLGWYCIRLTLWAMNWQMPLQVTGRILTERGRADSPKPVPVEFSGQLLFQGGVSAGFYCSFITEIQQWAIVSGARGYLSVSDFVLPFVGKEVTFDVVNSSYHINGTDFVMKPGRRAITIQEYSHGNANSQEAKLFRNFAASVLSGRLNEAWPDTALKTQRVMCACLDSAHADGRWISP